MHIWLKSLCEANKIKLDSTGIDGFQTKSENLFNLIRLKIKINNSDIEYVNM